ncbi:MULTISPECIES: glycosyltransferase family 39 protein [Kocuria]|uniref:Glycosyltransferase RgtA/B/C/D-like domain-containing protein n=1 Tax=Kocuria subflava TaxID=1736139 RepID=A0A846TRJ8_9MICC|nr:MULTISPECIES: hypothetical protein [Kocuria]NKE08464.1 hypothetical protein [Kocuria subflava]
MNNSSPRAMAETSQDKAPAVTGGTTSGATSTLPRIPWWPSLVAAVLAGIVAFWGMTQPQFWFDETATISAVERPLSSMVGMLSTIDAVHGLYYLVMYPWAAVFGTSELAMRTPSALGLMVTAAVITRIGMTYARRYMPQRMVFVGLLIAVIGAVLPGLTWTGQEARGYAMAAMSVSLAWWCFERFIVTRNGLLMVGFGLALAAATGFSLYCIFLLPVFFIRVLALGWKAALNYAIAGVLVVVACAPLAYIGSLQSAQVSWIHYTLREVLYYMAYHVFFISPRNYRGDFSDQIMAIAPFLALFAVLITVAGLILSRARGIMLWLLALIFFPFAVVVVAQLTGGQYFQERYLAFTSPAVVVLLALGLAAIPWRVAGAVLAVVFAGLSFPSLLGQNGEFAKDDAYGTAAQEAEQADTVIFMNEQHRGIFIAYPPEHEVADPMLVVDAADSETLWGINQPYELAWELEDTGSVAVVSYHDDANFPLVEGNLLENQCTLEDDNWDSRFRVTTFECPDTIPNAQEPDAAGPTPQEPGTQDQAGEAEPVTPGA